MSPNEDLKNAIAMPTPANDTGENIGRPNLLALKAAIEEAMIAVGDIRQEAIRQARTLAAAGLDDNEALRALAIAERNLAAAMGEATAALTNRARA